MRDNKNVTNLLLNKMTPQVLNYMYKQGGLVLVIGNTRDLIEDMNLEYAKSFANTFKECSIAKEFQVMFSVGGYDDDPRELYEIPSVIAYVKKLFEEVPWLFYFLCEESRKLIAIFHALDSVDKKNPKNATLTMSVDKANRFLRDMIEAIDEVDHITFDEMKVFYNELRRMF